MKHFYLPIIVTVITIGTFGCFHIKHKNKEFRSKEEIIIHDPLPIKDMIFPDDKDKNQFPNVEFGEDDSKKNENSWWPWN